MAEALPNRYANPSPIGRGGMGQIYLAEDRELGRKVAIKVLDDRFAGNEQLRERFKREALAAARLSGHPHVGTIFDVGSRRGARSSSWSTSRAERSATGHGRGRSNQPRLSPGSGRSPRPSTRPTSSASSTETSNRQTCSSTPAASS